jgi:hypothetical protein
LLSQDFLLFLVLLFPQVVYLYFLQSLLQHSWQLYWLNFVLTLLARHLFICQFSSYCLLYIFCLNLKISLIHFHPLSFILNFFIQLNLVNQTSFFFRRSFIPYHAKIKTQYLLFFLTFSIIWCRFVDVKQYKNHYRLMELVS